MNKKEEITNMTMNFSSIGFNNGNVHQEYIWNAGWNGLTGKQ